MGEIYNPDMDINKTFPIVKEIKTEKDGTIDSAIDDINSRLELDNLKLELPKTKEQQEKEVLELIQIGGLKKSFENNRFTKGVTVNKIEDGVFNIVSNKNGNVNYFVDENGDVLFGIVALVKRPFVKNGKAFEDAGYKEIKEDGLYNMYKVQVNENGEDTFEGPIDSNSKEYYEAWKNIIFYADILNKYLSLRFNDPETKIGIEVLIRGGSFKYEDLELFLEKGLITKEIFAYGVDELREVLTEQCNDPRLIGLTGFNGESLGIKESDLRVYLEKGYISQDLALKCYDVLPEVMKDLSK